MCILHSLSQNNLSLIILPPVTDVHYEDFLSAGDNRVELLKQQYLDKAVETIKLRFYMMTAGKRVGWYSSAAKVLRLCIFH